MKIDKTRTILSLLILGPILVLAFGSKETSDSSSSGSSASGSSSSGSSSSNSSTDNSGSGGLEPLAGNIFPGVKVYDRSGKYVGKIYSADPEGRDPYTGEKCRMIVFEYADGTIEPKKWDSVLKFGWYVKR